MRLSQIEIGGFFRPIRGRYAGKLCMRTGEAKSYHIPYRVIGARTEMSSGTVLLVKKA